MITIHEYLLSKTNKRTLDTIKATNDTIKDLVIRELEKQGEEADMNHIDVSEVTNMTNVFRLKAFKGDVSEWNVSNVTIMDAMFLGCKGFNGDLSRWDVSKVYSMSKMFGLDSQFEGIGLEKWKINKDIQYLDEMFIGCKAFNRDISSWNLDAKKLKRCAGMFKNCETFEQDISSWKMNKCAVRNEMFKNSPLARRQKLQPQFV